MDISALGMNIPAGLQPSLNNVAKTAASQPSQEGFGELMTKLVNRVDGLQKSADASVADVVAGRATDIHQVAVKVQEAGVAFDLMLGVRNRLMDAYNELVKMQP